MRIGFPNHPQGPYADGFRTPKFVRERGFAGVFNIMQLPDREELAKKLAVTRAGEVASALAAPRMCAHAAGEVLTRHFRGCANVPPTAEARAAADAAAGEALAALNATTTSPFAARARFVADQAFARAAEAALPCPDGAPGWQRGLWPLSSSVLPNYFTRGDQGGADLGSYSAALVAILNSQKAGSSTLRHVLGYMCNRAAVVAPTNSSRPKFRHPYGPRECAADEGGAPGSCCAGVADPENWASRVCHTMMMDRMLALTGDCGEGYGRCARCYPPGHPARAPRAPPPVVALHMFREPIERMVSAFRYCTSGWTIDALCGMYKASYANNTESTSSNLIVFASHWGGYATRRLLDNALLPLDCSAQHDQCVQVRAANEPITGSDGKPHTPTNGMLVTRGGGLETQFSAIGLLAQEELSLELWSEATGLPFSALSGFKSNQNGGPLAEEARARAAAGVGEHAAGGTHLLSTEDLLSFARGSPDVLAYLADDIDLYRAAEALFERQVAEYRRRGPRNAALVSARAEVIARP